MGRGGEHYRIMIKLYHDVSQDFWDHHITSAWPKLKNGVPYELLKSFFPTRMAD